MKLSEAIRLGAAMRPQCFFEYYTPSGGSCAIGAALEAVGDTENIEETLWPIITELNDMPCPDCGRLLSRSMIPHLNDDHRWTRERIADWVELHEPVDLGTCEHGITVEMDMNCPKCNEEAAVMDAQGYWLVSYSERNPTDAA